MTLKEIVTLVAHNAQISKMDAEVAVATVMEYVYSSLEKGEDVEIADTSIRALVEESS